MLRYLEKRVLQVEAGPRAGLVMLEAGDDRDNKVIRYVIRNDHCCYLSACASIAAAYTKSCTPKLFARHQIAPIRDTNTERLAAGLETGNNGGEYAGIGGAGGRFFYRATG